MNEELINNVVEEMAVPEVVEPVSEVVDAAVNSGNALAFAIGAAVGVAVTTVVATAPKVYHWGKSKWEEHRKKHRLMKQFKKGFLDAINNSGKEREYENDSDPEDDYEEDE